MIYFERAKPSVTTALPVSHRPILPQAFASSAAPAELKTALDGARQILRSSSSIIKDENLPQQDKPLTPQQKPQTGNFGVRSLAEEIRRQQAEKVQQQESGTDEEDDQPVWSGIVHNNIEIEPVDRLLKIIPGSIVN